MDEPGRLGRAPTDPAAQEGQVWGPSLAYLAMAVGIAAGALVYWWTSSTSTSPLLTSGGAASQALSPSGDSSHGQASAVGQSQALVHTKSQASETVAAAMPTRDANGDTTQDLRDYLRGGSIPAMADVIERLNQAGITTGLGAFSPPGTSPPLVGIAVPEGFVLPDGYVRHYQTTDDGQKIEPILMYAPDRQFFDAAGQPITVPKDRVVPLELAPPGLAARLIVIPAPLPVEKSRN